MHVNGKNKGDNMAANIGVELEDSQQLVYAIEHITKNTKVPQEWPEDYRYFPVDQGTAVAGVIENDGSTSYYSMWLERGENNKFDKIVLLNSQAEFDNMYRSRPDADKPNEVRYEVGGQAELVQTEDSKLKAKADNFLIRAFARARRSLSTLNGTSNTGEVLITLKRDWVETDDFISFYKGNNTADTSPKADNDPFGFSFTEEISKLAFSERLEELSAVSKKDIDAVKEDKIAMITAKKALSDIDKMMSSDGEMPSEQTQKRIFDALETLPGHRDIISDFVKKKMADPSLSPDKHRVMIMGRLFGMRPALGSVDNISSEFANKAEAGTAKTGDLEQKAAATTTARRSINYGENSGAEPKDLNSLGVLPPENADIVETYNAATQAIDYIKWSYMPSEPQENKLPENQIHEIIEAYRKSGNDDYADILKRMSEEAKSDPAAAFMTASKDIHASYRRQYDDSNMADLQANIDRGIDNARKHLNIDYDDIRNNLSATLERLGLNPDNLTEEQKDEIMEGVRNSVDGVAKEFDSLDDTRKAEIERTIKMRIEQRISEEYAKRISGTDDKMEAARQDAQQRYDEKAQALIDRINNLPEAQKEQICTNSGDNPIIQQACKP